MNILEELEKWINEEIKFSEAETSSYQ
jgi:hypothetical protein